MSARLRVGVVDDSAFNRVCIREWLQSTEDLELDSSLANGEEALRTWLTAPPDVAIVDLEMPKLDGLTLVRLLMAKRSFPIVVFSSYSSSDNVVRALEAGALRFVAKPDSLVDADATQLRAELLSAVREAARVDVSRLARARTELPSLVPGGKSPRALATTLSVLVTGTGGPQAMFEMVSGSLRLQGRAWVALMDMPGKYIYSLATRLGAKTTLDVVLLDPGEPLLENTLYLVPREMRLVAERDANGIVLHQSYVGESGETANSLLQSLASAIGANTSAALLTGGGSDGVLGLEAVSTAGGDVYVQNAHDAVVPELVLNAQAAGVPARTCSLAELRSLLAASERV